MSQSRAAVQPNRKAVHFCGLVILSVLLAVPALRLTHTRIPSLSFGEFSARSPFAGMQGSGPGFTSEEIQQKAAPLLERLAPRHGEVVAITGMGGRADGSTQRLLCLVCEPAADGAAGAAENPGADTPTGSVEVRYDVDTGELVSASTTSVIYSHRAVSDSTMVTASKAVQAARGWLRKLGLAGEQEAAPAIVFAPQKTTTGCWRVWLYGRERPGGTALVVEVVVTAGTGGLARAVVVDRAAHPNAYLPRGASHRQPDSAATAESRPGAGSRP